MPKRALSNRRFRYLAAMSLDGFIADKKGGVAWLDAFHGDYGMTAFFREIDTMVMGRKTLEVAMKLGPWPKSKNRTIVLSSRAIQSLPPGVEASKDAVGLIKELRSAKGKDIWIMGGGITAQTFLKNGALDEISVSIMPILLGSGITLFGKSTRLKLIDSKTFADGVVQATYQPS